MSMISLCPLHYHSQIIYLPSECIFSINPVYIIIVLYFGNPLLHVETVCCMLLLKSLFINSSRVPPSHPHTLGVEDVAIYLSVNI